TSQIACVMSPITDGPKISAIEIVGAATPAPTLTSIAPATASPGTSVAVTLNGTNFNSDVTINAGPNITVGNVTVASATQVTANFAVAAGSPTGNVNVTLTTTGGTTAAQPFSITLPAPTLTGISPTSGNQGTSVPVTLT